MAKLMDLVGGKFGRLSVVRRCQIQRKHKQAHWVCVCECGNETSVAGDQLRSGKTRSCGCLAKERAAQMFRRHGLSASKEHKSWRHMLGRCSNPNDIGWRNYGARGIKVCERWQTFENFYADMGPKPSPTHSVDRINVDGDYEPGNCRWATFEQQNNNRRSNRIIELSGKKQTLAEWSRETGIQAGTIAFRLKAGWPVEKALTSTV